MSFDISSLSVAETTDVHLRGPDDELLYTPEGKPVSITIYGVGSKPFAKAQSQASNRALDRFKRKGKTDLSAEDKAEERASFLASCTVSLNNFDYKGATDAAAVKAMYADVKLGFIADQVDKAMGDWSVFMKDSSSN